MTDNKRFAWTSFYMELADKLVPFAGDRAPLVAKIKAIFQKIEMNLPKLEKDGKVFDIDPFTTFGLFNKGISLENRIKIITGFAEEFSISASVPIEFDGIPVLNNQKATFYYFLGERQEHDIDNLWTVFSSALTYADTHTSESRESLIQNYDAVIQQKGVKWNLTMGLFWFRPMEYLNLDIRNRWFISQPKNTSKEFTEALPIKYNGDNSDFVPSGQEYLKICESCKAVISASSYTYKTFPELSAEAWKAVKENDKIVKTAEIQKLNYRKWLTSQGELKTPSAISKNVSALDDICSEMSLENFTEYNSLFSISDLENFNIIRNAIKNHNEFKEIKKKHGNGYLSSALSWYEKFLQWLADGGDPDSLEDKSNVNTLADDTSNDVRYWMYTVFDDESWKECHENGIMVVDCDEIGDYLQYDSKESVRQALIENYDGDSTRKNLALMVWSFSNGIKIGDVVFAKRANTLVGKGIVTGEYVFDDSRQQYKNVRKVEWKQIGKWDNPEKAAAKRLTDISPYTDYVDKLNAIFAQEGIDEDTPEINYPPYSKEDFLTEVYMAKEDYDNLVARLKKKKNIILQGAPGVGKTYAARRLAYSIMGKRDKERVMMVQFHQSYSYEDFIMGFRPSATGFELKKGAFYKFCRKAEDDSDNDYFFIIDEINRGNLSKIFGELFMLIEADKRGIELQLLYSDERFSVPKNVYIIGMMNTADRSLAMLDFALRRRFSFFSLKPGFETEGFREYSKSFASKKFDNLITCIKSLNDVITKDDSLGEGFCIGHSYFCNLSSEQAIDQDLFEIVEFELIPLLKEYWFDDPAKVRDWSTNLREAIK